MPLTLSRPDLDTVVKQLPLVAWGRPPCPPLPDRVAVIARDVAALDDSTSCNDTLEAAAAQLNLAALIASDCRQPDLAHDLCWQQLDAFTRLERPLSLTEATLMLGPPINLARLRLRADDGDRALSLLVALLRGVRRRADVDLDGRTLPLSAIDVDEAGHRELVKSTWMLLLTDGAKALTLAGRWAAAAELAASYKGVGDHLFEGRQATIISRVLDDDPDSARALLTASTVTEPWEHEVAACLTVLLAGPDTTANAVERLVTSYNLAAGRPDRPHYRARFGVTTAILVRQHDPDLAEQVLHTAAAEVLDAPDGYAAREVLRHPSAQALLTGSEARLLDEIVQQSGLTGEHLTGRTLAVLLDATARAQQVLAQTLRTME